MQDLEAFFHDLRALRTGAGLSIADLAERAHFPEETLAAAETGPAVPSNPVLIAYVQGCGGPMEEWEDRWREASAASAGQTEAHTEFPGPADVPKPVPARSRLRRRAIVTVGVAALVAGGSVAVLARPAGHGRLAGHGGPVAGRTAPGIQEQVLFPSLRERQVVPSIPEQQTESPRTAPSAAPRHSTAPQVTSVAEIAGVGCPDSHNASVTLDAAKPGPPWMAAQGGWTGNGCDGASVWTMDPAGKPSPSTLTWSFGGIANVSQCTLSVFVPTQNALGQAEYAVFSGSDGLGTVTIDQAAEAGRWVALGSFPATGSGYAIQLMPQAMTLTAAGPAAPGKGRGKAGPASPPGHNSAIAASAAAMTCSGP
jgi:transcriptional regulator with XRE-family HTH domain